MDLSSLQNDLPPGKSSPPPLSLPPAALTSDFKAAALAVTKLYQNSARQIDQARQEGYLAAVQEVASLLSHGELAGNRLREWCAVGLSRITAQQDEENRSRPAQRDAEDSQPEHDGSERRDAAVTETAVSPGSPALHSRMSLPNSFMDTEFTFQSPLPARDSGREYSPSFGGRMEPEVTYEVVENHRSGTGRKRCVNHQLGSIWDVGGNIGHKRSRHM